MREQVERVVELGDREQILQRGQRVRATVVRLAERLDELEQRDRDCWDDPMVLLRRVTELMAGAERSGSRYLKAAQASAGLALTILETFPPVTRAEFEEFKAEFDRLAPRLAYELAVSF